MSTARKTITLALASILTACLTALSQTLYWCGGTSDIADGTPIPTTAAGLSGRWDATTKNWCSDTNLLTYVAWSNGDDRIAYLMPFSPAATATITQTVDVVLNQIRAPHNRVTAGDNFFYSITATNSQTITLAGFTPTLHASSANTTRALRFQSNVRLIAASGFTKTGNGQVQVFSDSPDVVGKATINGSAGTGVKIESTGKLLGITEFDVQSNGGLIVGMASGVNDRVHDAAIVRLRGHGELSPSGVASASEVVNQVILQASGVISLAAGSGAIKGRMIIAHPTAGIDRGVDGKAPLYFDANLSDAFQTDVVVSNGVPSGVLLPWAATLRSRPIQLNASTLAFEPIAVTPAPNDVTTWSGSGTSYRLEGNFIPSGPVPTVSIASLGIYHTNTAYTLTIGASDTLTLAAGQLSFSPNGGQSTTKTITGGQITSGTDELYILTGNSGANQTFTISSALVGNMSVIRGGSRTVLFSGDAMNTYTGTTYVNHGPLQLQKTVSQGAIPGDIVINAYGNLILNNAAIYNINTNANVTIREGGTLTHNNSAAQAYSGTMTFNGGTLSIGGANNSPAIIFNRPGTGIVFDNGGTLTQTVSGSTTPIQLLTDVRYDAACTNAALFTTVNPAIQYLDLTTSATTGTVTRTFDIADGAGLASATNEMVIDIPLRDAVTAPAILAKTGMGVLSLERFTGQFSGGAVVTGGTLLVNAPFTTKTVQSATTVNNSTAMTNLSSTNGLRVAQLITGTGIPAGTVISAFTSATALTMSQNSSQSTTTTRSFEACGALGTGSVVVAESGKLGGSGGVCGKVTVNTGGTLAPGSAANPLGIFTVIGSVDLSGGGALAIDLLNDTTADQVVVQGAVTLGGVLTVNPLSGYLPKVGAGPWTILTATDGVSGTFSTVPIDVSVSYTANSVIIRTKRPGTLISIY